MPLTQNSTKASWAGRRSKHWGGSLLSVSFPNRKPAAARKRGSENRRPRRPLLCFSLTGVFPAQPAKHVYPTMAAQWHTQRMLLSNGNRSPAVAFQFQSCNPLMHYLPPETVNTSKQPYLWAQSSGVHHPALSWPLLPSALSLFHQGAISPLHRLPSIALRSSTATFFACSMQGNDACMACAA